MRRLEIELQGNFRGWHLSQLRCHAMYPLQHLHFGKTLKVNNPCRCWLNARQLRCQSEVRQSVTLTLCPLRTERLSVQGLISALMETWLPQTCHKNACMTEATGTSLLAISSKSTRCAQQHKIKQPVDRKQFSLKSCKMLMCA